MSGQDDPYVFPGTRTLKNRLSITNPIELDRVERRLSVARIKQGVPAGDFDLIHLKSIHRHLFQDIYELAGEIRTVEISKGTQQFQFRQYIQTGMADVHRRLMRSRSLAGFSRRDFAQRVAVIIGDVNYIHPFREGNGRAQLQYLKLLAERAGHPIDLTRIEASRWLEASQVSHAADYALMEKLIASAVIN